MSLGLHSSAKFSVESLNSIGRAQRFPLAVVKTVKRQQLFSGLLQACHHFGKKLFPLHDKLPVSFPQAAELLLFGLIISGQIRMRLIDGWRELKQVMLSKAA
jgi:hypothetical protein